MKRIIIPLFLSALLLSACGVPQEARQSQQEHERDIQQAAYKQGYDDGFLEGRDEKPFYGIEPKYPDPESELSGEEDDSYHDGYIDGFASGYNAAWKELTGDYP